MGASLPLQSLPVMFTRAISSHIRVYSLQCPGIRGGAHTVEPHVLPNNAANTNRLGCEIDDFVELRGVESAWNSSRSGRLLF